MLFILKDDLRSSGSKDLTKVQIEYPDSEAQFPDEFFLIIREFHTPINVTFQRIHKHHKSYPVLENDVYVMDESGIPTKHLFRGRQVVKYPVYWLKHFDIFKIFLFLIYRLVMNFTARRI